jgi:hypothetical protein
VGGEAAGHFHVGAAAAGEAELDLSAGGAVAGRLLGSPSGEAVDGGEGVDEAGAFEDGEVFGYGLSRDR